MSADTRKLGERRREIGAGAIEDRDVSVRELDAERGARSRTAMVRLEP